VQTGTVALLIRTQEITKTGQGEKSTKAISLCGCANYAHLHIKITNFVHTVSRSI